MLTVKYERMVRMEPREGLNYSTVYIKQTPAQRLVLSKHIERCCRDIIQVVTLNTEWKTWIETPLKGFKTTAGQNRSCLDIITDLFDESRGLRRNGELKDYALAPIERWNRLFKDTDYEFELMKITELESKYEYV
jgi:hypothetical protein